ncbi:MAG: protein translocase subunit SecF [Desulfobacterales bacterium]|jgi:preprotein translocase subunit SecF|nr:protein translocase subunit SecF [Desulfobacteraceae bacterium]MDD3991094.1 protein translocase subunit SecF [Desulfobacteraceae bacterium]MDY0310691.1 protein translocase subunit SecF [Desulfobacterales bacterium]
MQFIKPGINIDFIGKRRAAYVVSALLILLSIVTLIWHRGPRYGIDFVGGTVIQVKFQSAVDIDTIKQAIAEAGLGQATVQRFGQVDDNEYLIRSDMADNPDQLSERVAEILAQRTATAAEIQRLEMVGPQVGKDLQKKALQAIFYSLLFIAIYISGRFEQRWTIAAVIAAALIGAVYGLSLLNLSMAWLILAGVVVTLALFWFLQLRYAMGAIVALIHDVGITVGVFSLLDKEFTLPIIAALLTIIGYSLNDTIIVFDRIRENIRNHPRRLLDETVNRSINETLSRTILTSGTTLIVVLALALLGGGIIHDFALALLIGILVGTYSSIYIASPILLLWQGRTRRA